MRLPLFERKEVTRWGLFLMRGVHHSLFWICLGGFVAVHCALLTPLLGQTCQIPLHKPNTQIVLHDDEKVIESSTEISTSVPFIGAEAGPLMLHFLRRYLKERFDVLFFIHSKMGKKKIENRNLAQSSIHPSPCVHFMCCDFGITF